MVSATAASCQTQQSQQPQSLRPEIPQEAVQVTRWGLSVGVILAASALCAATRCATAIKLCLLVVAPAM